MRGENLQKRLKKIKFALRNKTEHFGPAKMRL